MASVKTLWFETNQLNDELAFALADSSMLDQIEQLIILKNRISEEGEDVLWDRFGAKVRIDSQGYGG